MAVKARARDLGVIVGTLPTGPLNAITDVAGVRVGHATLNQGANIRTGVTAILPAQVNRQRSGSPRRVSVLFQAVTESRRIKLTSFPECTILLVPRRPRIIGGNMAYSEINRVDPAILTERESQLLQLLAQGKTTKEIATVLDLTCSTVSSHRKHLCRKMGVHSTAELIAHACRISPP